MKKITISLIIAVLTLGGFGMSLPSGAAAEQKTLVAVSVAGYSELMDNLVLIGRLGGRPELNKVIEDLIETVTRGAGLEGMDQKQPFGLAIQTDGGVQFNSIGFLPVGDWDQLKLLMKNPQTGNIPEAENGVYTIPLGAQKVYVTERDKWAYASNKKEALLSVPDDPLVLLDDLPRNYLAAVRASIKDIPEFMRQAYLTSMQMGMEMGAKRRDEESDEQYDARLAMQKHGFENMKLYVEQLDNILLGLNIDRPTNKLCLDLAFIVQPGSELATKLTALKAEKSDFAWLAFPDAAFTYSSIKTLSDADVDVAKNELTVWRFTVQERLKQQKINPVQLDVAMAIIGKLFDAASKTFEAKHTDVCATFYFEPNALTLAAGFKVIDGGKLEEALKSPLLEARKEQLIELNEETYQDFQLYNLSLAGLETADLIPKLVPLVGDHIEIAFSISNNKMLITAGRDAAKTLKKVLDKSLGESAREVPSNQWIAKAAKIARFYAEMADTDREKNEASDAAEKLEQAAGKDGVILTVQPITDGFSYHLEAEEGLFKLLALIPLTSGM